MMNEIQNNYIVNEKKTMIKVMIFSYEAVL